MFITQKVRQNNTCSDEKQPHTHPVTVAEYSTYTIYSIWQILQKFLNMLLHLTLKIRRQDTPFHLVNNMPYQ